jgi:hypothetical protein
MKILKNLLKKFCKYCLNYKVINTIIISTPDNQQFGRPFGPQDCEELNACLASADCKNE